VRTVDRQDVHPRQHLVQAFPVGRLQLGLDLGAQALAVVIVDLKPEGPRTTGNRLTDPTHAEDAKPAAAQPAAKVRHRRPAGPAAGLHHLQTLRNAPRHRSPTAHREAETAKAHRG